MDMVGVDEEASKYKYFIWGRVIGGATCNLGSIGGTKGQWISQHQTYLSNANVNTPYFDLVSIRINTQKSQI